MTTTDAPPEAAPIPVELEATVQDAQPPRVQITATGLGADEPLLDNGSFENDLDGWTPGIVPGLVAETWTAADNPDGLAAAEGGMYARTGVPGNLQVLATNLATYPSAEHVGAEGWETYRPVTLPPEAVEDGAAPSGSMFIRSRQTPESDSGNPYLVFQDLTDGLETLGTGAGTYRISAQYRVSGPDATLESGPGMRLTGTGTTGTNVAVTELEQWQRLTHVFEWDGVGDVKIYTNRGDGATGTITVDVDAIILTAGEAEVEFFDGDTPDDGIYQYQWTRQPGESASIKIGEPTQPRTAAQLPPMVTLSRVVPVDPGETVLASAKVSGTTGQSVAFRLTPTVGGSVEEDAGRVSDSILADQTMWQTASPDTLTLGDTHDGVLLEFVTTSSEAMPAAAAVTLDTYIDDVAIVVPNEAGTITLYRVVEGTRTPVRGVIDVTPTGTIFIAVDNGAPFGVDVSYVLVQTHPDGTVTETQSNTVQLTADLPWVSHPITGEGVALTISEWPEYTYSARQTIVPVAGRPDPIAVSDVRLARSSEITFFTRTRSQLMALRSLLATGDVLQIRPVCDAVEPDYVAIGDVTETRVQPTGVGAGANWKRYVKCAVQAVAQPAPEIAAHGDTLADLAAYVPTTLGDLATAFGPDATLLTIAQTHLSSAANTAGNNDLAGVG